MKFSVAIMMHPRREKYREYLISKLGNVQIITDRGKGIWDTARRAWLSYDKTADYHLVIQDDAIIGKNFYQNLEKEILAHPGMAYCLYYGQRKDIDILNLKKWIKAGGVEKSEVHWGVALCIPVSIIDDFIKEADKLTRYEKHDDTKLSKYLIKKKIKVWYPIPSLVDHRWEEKSLMEINYSNKKRKAVLFIGE